MSPVPSDNAPAAGPPNGPHPSEAPRPVTAPLSPPVPPPVAEQFAEPTAGQVAEPTAAPVTAPGLSLRQLLLSLREPLVELRGAPHGLDVEVGSVALLDPADRPSARPGELVLAIGVRGRAAALPVLRAAARGGAAAVALRIDTPAQADALREAAEDAGVALLAVPAEVGWEQVDAQARAALGAAGAENGAADGAPLPDEGDLFALAQTTAVLTGGIVSIEDTANRILAYSRSADSDEIDDLRRATILGWQGPEPYLSKLRSWGVFQQLRAGEAVVAVDAHPELGLRRRLAVAIRSGTRQLGTIWVQEGSAPLAEHAAQALLGAARVAALHLVSRRRELSSELRLTRNLLSRMLQGAASPQTLAAHSGLDARRPAAVLGFAVPGTADLTRDEAVNLIAVHAAARHRTALVAPADDRVYVLLPELPRGVAAPALRGWAEEVAEAAERHLGLPLRGGVGALVPTLSGAPASRREADRILDAMTAGQVASRVAALTDVQAQVLLGETLALLLDHPAVRDPRLEALRAHDREHGGRLAASVLAWLDAFGDVRTAAEALHVHPNTLRYRIRRAEQLTGLDLAQPEQRLLAMLQLRLPD